MSHPKAEIISIGNELLSGYTANSNATFIAQQMLAIGLPVHWITTISDTPEEILFALQTSNQRAQVVLVTGGLGPTPDDITKKTICEYFDTELRLDRNVLKHVERLLKSRGLAMLESNRRQALVPRGAEILANPNGTAPGLVLQKSGSYFLFMPGVPVEMHEMIKSQVVPFLTSKIDLPVVHNRLLRTTGIAESRLYELIKDILNRYRHFQVAFLPRYIGVDLRFRLISDNSEQVANFETFLAEIKGRAEKYIFSEESIELEEKIGQLLLARKMNLSCAESFTGGLVSDLITNIPGSSKYYAGGVVTYSNESKISLLKVNPGTIQTYGAVSVQTVSEMVRSVQNLFQSDCALATTGIAGPTGATQAKPVGLSYIAGRVGEKERIKEFHFGQDRLSNKKRGAVAALELLRRLLLEFED